MPHARVEGPSIQHYILLRKWSVLAITLLCLASALLFSLQMEPVYESEARVLVRGVASANPGGSATVTPPNLETERGIAASASVARFAKERLDLEAPSHELIEDLTVDIESDSEILVLKYLHEDPLEAARLTQGFADAYLAFRLQEAVEELTSNRQSLSQQIDLLDDQLTLINRRIDASDSISEKETLETQASLLAGLIVQTQVSQLTLPQQPTVGRIVQPAVVPESPVSPNHPRSAAMGLMVGLALGVAQATLRGRVDDRVHSVEELEALVRTTVPGTIPPVSGWRRSKKSPIIDSSSVTPESEAFRILRTNVLATTSVRGVRTLLVTSSRAAEGKTVISSNLALTIASAGKKVVLVSADLKRPRVHLLFGVDGSPGLAEILQRRIPAKGLLRPTQEPNLAILPSGRSSENSAELLGSAAMAGILASLKEHAELVIIDSAPLSSADAVALTPLVDSVLFVVDPAQTVRISVHSARRQLDRLNAHVLGAVFNNSDPEKAEGYSYYGPAPEDGFTARDFDAAFGVDHVAAPAPTRPADRS
jgi:capsular exopolysaccharide synthesis family protein